MDVKVGDVLIMKKNHPCGSSQFKIARVGSDIRIICLGCDRDMTLNRIKLEKVLKKHIQKPQENAEKNNG